MSTVERDRRETRSRCALCGASLSDSAVETATGASFCSTGCRDVETTLPESSGRTGEDRNERDEGGADESRIERDGADSKADEGDEFERTYLRIDGMHSAMCESFLESIATGYDGVERASASYVTEAVRIDYDPEHVSAAELQDALSTLGYTAYRREEATAGDDESGGTRRSREMTGIRKRRSNDMLEVRYIVGIVFGTFLLIPYVTVFYPIYLSEFSEWGVLRYYAEGFAEFDGVLFLPLFFVTTGIVLYLTGLPLLRGAYVSLKRRRPNTHLLAALTIVSAYLYGTMAFVRGSVEIYYDLTILVAALVMAAVFAEATVKRRASERLTDLTISQVETARRLEPGGTTTSIPVADLESDDRLLVREGERIPVDGVLESSCTVDESVVTGESLPISKSPGEAAVGGSVVTTGAAVVDVGDETESSIDRLTETVWNVQSADHGGQRRADYLARRVAPFVFAAAATVGTTLYALGGTAADVTMAVLLTVMVASPWALGLATPVSVAASVREAMEHGIIVFDETVFERLQNVDVVVFDKTGTLTTGEMTVFDADAPEKLVSAAAALERRASHPAAAAIVDALADDSGGTQSARSDGGMPGHEPDTAVEEFRSHETGVEGVVDGERVLVGHPGLFRDRGWTVDADLDTRLERARDAGRLPVVVGWDGRAEGVIVVGDESRTEWEETVTSLHESDIEVVVLTGDTEPAAERFDGHPCVDHLFAAVPPGGKTAAIRRLKADNRVAMVGDGTNDAPALAEADLGISLGGGTALAADAADLAIVEDDLAAVDRAFRLSENAQRRLRQNLGLAFVYNAIVVPVVLLGALNPLVTTAAVIACTALVAGNASRALVDA
ncbi:heavy metal translocating P-type ATPase [Natrialbaceae archaeon A-arb3/5]